MKRTIRILLCLVMVLVVALCVLTACHSTTIQSVKFKITFDVDGTNYFEINTQGTEVLQMPNNPVKEDYIFDGWYWDKDTWKRAFTANSLLNEALSADMRVYAKWKRDCAHTNVVEDIGYDATCTENGLTNGSHCEDCGVAIVQQEVIPALKHAIMQVVEKEPTCTDIGWNAYEYCTRCEYTTKVEFEATGHSSEWIVDIEPDCLTNGHKVEKCKICHIVLGEEEIDALNHDIKQVSAKEPTCTDIGWYDYEYCSRCDYITKVERNTIAHSAGEWIMDIEPNCIQGGHRHKECIYCQKSLVEEDINVVDHNIVIVEAQEPTCTEIGWNRYEYCTNCDYTTKQEIAALGHHFADDWKYDNTYHWHIADCGHDVISEKQIHTCTNDSICNICNQDKGIKYSTYSNGYAVIGYTGTCKTVIVPETYNDKPVLAIGSLEYKSLDTLYVSGDGFYECGNIDTVVLPQSIRTINVGAFAYSSIKEITIPSTCRLIRDYVFLGCERLNNLTIDGGSFDSNLFVGCYDIENITVGSKAQFKDGVFKECRSLKSLSIANLNTTAGALFGSKTYASETGFDCRRENTNIQGTYYGVPIGGSWYPISWQTVDGVEMYCRKADMTITKYTTIVVHDKAYPSIVYKTWEEATRAEFLSYYIPKTLRTLTITEQVLSINDSKITQYPFNVVLKNHLPATSLTVNGESEIYVDEFALENYTFTWRSTDRWGTEKLTDEYLLSSDIRLLQTVGTHTVYINFENKLWPWTVTLKNHQFDSAVMNDLTVVEDGTAHYLVVDGVPSDTTVEYINNGQTEVGEYIVTATLTKQYYDSKTLTAKLSVRQPNYSIAYDLGYDDSIENDNPNTYTYGETLQIKDISRGEYWEFLGWFDNPYYNGQPITQIQSGEYGNKTLYARWRSIFEYNYYGAINGLTSKGKEKENIVIPTSIDGTTIIDISNNAFKDCTNLKSVIISNSLTSIGNYAFRGCSGLTSVTIGNSVKSIGDDAFSGCSRLEAVYITDIANWCEISFYDSIANPLFYAHNLYLNGELVTDLVIPDNVTSIGDYAFRGCSGLTSVTIGNSVKSIGSYAFDNCYKLKSVNIGSGVTSVGDYAFDFCSKLTSVFVDKDNANYASQDGILYNKNKTQFICIPQALQGVVTIPDGVTSIGASAFRGCSGLTSITIPDSVASIGSQAFEDCSGLTSITIPDSVASIGSRAFEDCSRLTSITIPDSVTSIGNYAFADCSSLEAVYITDLAKWCGISFGYYFANPLCYGHNLYLNGELVTDLVIPDSVTSIGDYAFRGCSGLTSVTIPDSVTSIGDYAFKDCSRLTSVTIPDSVTSIGNYAFEDCSRLTSITIPDSVTSIGNGAFRGCSGLTSITIPDSVTYMGSYAFEECSGLTSVNIGNSVKGIGNNAFGGCSGLTSITIGNSVTSIGDYAFRSCSGLTSITIPDSVTSIGSYAFIGCSGLTSITISDSVKSLQSDAFAECSKLKEVYYKGTAENWKKILPTYSSYNSYLTNKTYYYSETKPTDSGKYWHYDEDGNIVVW